MAITYTVSKYDPITSSSVEVIYTNSENGFQHKRTINIPRLEDGNIDEEYFSEILVGQLRGVENKIKLGVITFTDPSEIPEPAPVTPEVPETISE